MSLLEKIAQRHKMWIAIVRNFGIDDYAEDIVQEMYVKINKYIEAGTLREQTINTYVYTVLRSISCEFKNQKYKYFKVELTDNMTAEGFDKDQEEAYERIILSLEEEIEGWHWFDKMLFKDIYIDQDLSMRGIEEKTNISLATIFNTIKRCKNKCKDVALEDFIDYKNEEYERI